MGQTNRPGTHPSCPMTPVAQSKPTTHAIERHHARQRHECRRFKRKSIFVSEAKEIVDLTMALCADFWVKIILMNSSHYLVETFENCLSLLLSEYCPSTQG
jgi:hypothetical protein